MGQLEKVADYPAYRVYRHPPRLWGEHFGAVGLVHNQRLGLRKMIRGQECFIEYLVGTVAGMAVENGQDAIKAIESNRAKGGQDHWINACGCALTAHKREQRALTLVEVGMLVTIEERDYKVVAERNENLGLEPVDLKKELDQRHGYAQEVFWEYERGTIQAPEAVEQMAKLGVVADVDVLRDARARNIPAAVKINQVDYQLAVL